MCSSNMCKTKESDVVHEGLRIRAYPTPAQEQRLEAWLESLRQLYNQSLAERKEAYQEHGVTITHRQQRDALPRLKKQNAGLKDVYSGATQNCLQRLQDAYEHFFERVKKKKSGFQIKAGYPRFRKYGRYHSLNYPQVWMNQKGVLNEVIHLEHEPFPVPMPKNSKAVKGHLELPKLGALAVRLHRPVDWSEAKSVTLKRMPNGHWYACVCLERTLEREDKGREEKRGGVDVGLSKLATTSEGEQFAHPRFLRNSEEKLKKEQRKLSRKKKGSKNREKQRRRVAKVHQKIANQRLDFLHKLSLWLVLRFSHVAFEDLNIAAMVRNPRFAKSILDAGWGILIELTTYKSVKLGGRTAQVDPRYTTQDCSRCGCRVPKTLAERIHCCPRCGLVMDRDQNAAINIRNRVGTGCAEPCDSG